LDGVRWCGIHENCLYGDNGSKMGRWPRSSSFDSPQMGRVTLVLATGVPLVRTLWALMDADNIEAAREALRSRENTSTRRPEHIGSWTKGQPSPLLLPTIERWADARQLDGVIWTALPPKFAGDDRTASSQEILDYLDALAGPARDNAERYVRRTPRQVDTEMRRLIEARLGWTALSAG
jgi:hypothetical protein